MPIPKPTQAEKDKLEVSRAYQLANPTLVSPCIDQTAADIAAYYRNVDIGNPAVVRQTQGNILRYTITSIEGTNPKLGRVYVESFGAFYAKHGKNCYHPTGQTTLVVPTPEVLAWADMHPGGEMGVSCWR